MKEVIVTLQLKVNDNVSIEEVMDQIYVDLYKCVEEVVSIHGEVVENEDPADLCMM